MDSSPNINYIEIVENLADNFIKNPVDYVTESDIQVHLVHMIREALGKINAENSKIANENTKPLEPEEDKKPAYYKELYFEKIKNKLNSNKFINRVHTEVSIKTGRRIDIVIFYPTLKKQITWVRRGSKRFDKSDVEVAFELKFIKNKYNVSMSKSEINLKENKIESDIDDLGELDNSKKFLLIFSNNNYLYHNPSKEEKEQRNGEYLSRGEKAREILKQKCENNQINLLYVYPLGKEWIYRTSRK